MRRRLHFGELLCRHAAFRDQLVRVHLEHVVLFLDNLIHKRLGEHRLVDLVVSVAAEADDVYNYVLAERLPELCCRLHHPTHLHTSAFVSIRRHTSAFVSIRQHTSAFVSIRQHSSAFVSIRQHTSAYVSADCIGQHTPPQDRQHTSAYVSIRQHTSV
jgi:hypothetical protein